MNKSPQSHQVKAKSGFWLLNPASKVESVLLSLLILFLPTQLGKHFWPSFSLVSGIRIDYLAPTLYVTDMLIGLLFIFFALRLQKTHQKIQPSVTHVTLIICVFFVAAVNISFSGRPLLSAYYWIKFAEMSFLALYLAHGIRQQAQLFSLALLIAVGAFFESLLAILQFFNQGSLNGWLYYLGERSFTAATPGIANASINGDLYLRPYGTFSHPNVLAGYLLLASLLICFFLLSTAKGFVRVFGISVLLLSGVALTLTLSRISILLWTVLLGGFCLRWILQQAVSLRRKIILLGMFGMIIALISTFPFIQTIIDRFTGTSLTEGSFLERTDLISYSFTLIQNHPLFGVGLGTFIPSLAPLIPMLSAGTTLQPVHMIFLLVASEVGFAGLILFGWLIGRTLFRIKKHESRIKIPMLFLLGCIMITGLFDHYWLTLQQGQLLFALVLGLCWARIHSDIIAR